MYCSVNFKPTEEYLGILMLLFHSVQEVVHVIWNSGKSGIQEQLRDLGFLVSYVMLSVDDQVLSESGPVVIIYQPWEVLFTFTLALVSEM